MRLLIIRHAEPDYAKNSLTSRGHIEAQYLAERLAQEPIDAFFVSPMGRAQATAAPTLEKRGATACTCDWLHEFDHPIRRPDRGGALSHVPWDWLPQDLDRHPQLLDADHWAEDPLMVEGGVGPAYAQVTACFDQLLADNGYVREGLYYRAERPNTRTLAFVCHLGAACVLLSHLIHVSPMALWQGTAVQPSSVTTVYTEERRPGIASFRITALGDISHLYIHKQAPSFAGRFCEVYGNGDRED